MARRRRTRRTRVEEEPIDELDVEEEEEEEEEEEAPKPRSRRRKPAPKEVEADEEELEEEDYEDDDEEEEEPEPEPKPKRRSRRSRKVVEEEEEDDEDEVPEVYVKKVDQQVVEDVARMVLDTLEDGKSILITRLKKDQYQLSIGAEVKRHKLSPSEFWREVANPAYIEWSEEWKKKSYKEKVSYARKNKIKWDEYPDDERVDVIRLSLAVRKAEGIEKYKEEYRTKSARMALRG